MNRYRYDYLHFLIIPEQGAPYMYVWLFCSERQQSICPVLNVLFPENFIIMSYFLSYIRHISCRMPQLVCFNLDVFIWISSLLFCFCNVLFTMSYLQCDIYNVFYRLC